MQFSRWIIAVLLLAAGIGCHRLPTARYIGPEHPAIGGLQAPSASQTPMNVTIRGQTPEGYAAPPGNAWNNYQPPVGNGAAPANTGGAYASPPAGPPGFVGGTIPVQGNTQPMPVIVDPNTAGGFGQPMPPPGTVLAPDLDYADVDIYAEETETGRFMFGVGVNSDAGVTGQIVIDERNFDLFRPPTSFGEIVDGTAFRGAGQGLRIEAVPGSQVQRYVVNFTEPYLFDTNVSFNSSAFFFDRIYRDWDEQRFGGRLGLGYRLTPDLSIAASGRAEQVEISDPRLVGVSPSLDAAVGEHTLYGGGVTLTHDTRDVPFNPSEGHMFELKFEQTFGDFDYPKVEADYRRYILIAERPDGSGRHVVAVQIRGGITGAQTPVFENFFAGGYSTLRGFDFRGASPVEGDIRVGGELMLLGTLEYRFPLTADDMISGVVFCDYGTVEEDLEIQGENFRVAPGFGLRIAVPAMGPAPIALDFAFPVAYADTDEREVFSFFVGVGR
jgi:outer membrane protein insertion porin family